MEKRERSRRIGKKWCILWISALLSISAESYGGRPNWIREIPEGECFVYFVGMGHSEESEWWARRGAIVGALGQIAMSERVEISAEVRDIMRAKNGEAYEKFVSETVAKGTSSLVKGLWVKEVHWEVMEKGCNYWTLVRVPKVRNWRDCERGVKDRIARIRSSAAWRSALVPGWGQFYKKHRTKGWMFLTAEGLLFPTALITGIMSSNAHEDAIHATRQVDRDYYNDRSDLFYNLSVTSWIVAGGLYLYNIFDAGMTQEAKVYAKKHTNEGDGLTFRIGGDPLITCTFRF